MEHSAALDILNVVLGLLKLLATYGRKAFARAAAIAEALRGNEVLTKLNLEATSLTCQSCAAPTR